MLYPRVIPVLLFKDGGLVKTIKFQSPIYIGDPINAVKIFNDKEVDEVIFLDITKSRLQVEPNYSLIEEISNECFVPFAYGGSVNSIASIKKIFKLGAEKVIINSAAFKNPHLITEASLIFGSQSIVVSIDYKKNIFGHNKVYIESGKRSTRISPLEYAMNMQELGAGELYVNSIDKEGTRSGYDIDVLSEITSAVSIPVIASGGADNIYDMKEAIERANVSAVSAGTMFVYYGKKNGVLINYPNRSDIISLLTNK